MVPAKSWQRPEFLKDGFPAFSRQATEVLKNIISPDSTIVLTASHKSNYTIGEWKEIFERRDTRVDRLKSLNQNTTNLSRKDEVLNWFNAHDMKENFVIIDDDKSLNDLPTYVKSHLVLTSSMVGLTD